MGRRWDGEMEMAMRRMVGRGPDGVPSLGSQLRGRHPSLGPKPLPRGGGGGSSGGDVPGSVRDSGCGCVGVWKSGRGKAEERLEERSRSDRTRGQDSATAAGCSTAAALARTARAAPRGGAPPPAAPPVALAPPGLPSAPSCRLQGSDPQPLASLSPVTTRGPPRRPSPSWVLLPISAGRSPAQAWASSAQRTQGP